jgi:hypothetical protein
MVNMIALMNTARKYLPGLPDAAIHSPHLLTKENTVNPARIRNHHESKNVSALAVPAANAVRAATKNTLSFTHSLVVSVFIDEKRSGDMTADKARASDALYNADASAQKKNRQYTDNDSDRHAELAVG